MSVGNRSNDKIYDITVVGGGIIGLLFAARLSLLSENLEICVIQDAHPTLNWLQEDLPDRVSALNNASKELFEELGLWDSILDEAAPYFHMFVWDKESRAEIEFDRSEIGLSSLGYIVPTRILQKTLWEYLSSKSQIHLETGSYPINLQVNSKFVDLQLKEKIFRSRLLVGADGATSWVHQAAGFERYDHDYHHFALTACVRTEKPHDNTAFQCFSQDEILAFLPLKDLHVASIVWSAPPRKVDQLIQLSSDEFNFSLMQAIEGKLGSILSSEKKCSFPLRLRHSKAYAKARIALIGDAIHTIHPLAGQGMNLGFKDAVCLSDCIKQAYENGRDIGSLSVLRAYERSRVGDNWKMIALMSLIKGFFCNDLKWSFPFRPFFVNQVKQHAFVKRYLMRQASGVKIFS